MAVLYVPMMIAIFMPIFALSFPKMETPPNPCPDVFSYIYSEGEFFGAIRQMYPTKTHVNITIEMTQPGILKKNYKGKISPNREIKTNYINLDLPITYRVDFPQMDNPPLITKIMENDIITCSGVKWLDVFPSQNSLPRADIKLTYTIEEERNSRELRELNAVCGQENEPTMGRVINTIKYPWMATIHKTTYWGASLQCEGTLISRSTVISVAACGFYDTNGFSIKYHSVNLRSNDYTDGMNIQVKAIVVNPDYVRDRNSEADIALLQLAESVTFSHDIRPICLPKSNRDLIEETVGYFINYVLDPPFAEFKFTRLVRSTITSGIECRGSTSLMSNQTSCGLMVKVNPLTLPDYGCGLIVQKFSRWILRGVVRTSFTYLQGQYDPTIWCADTVKFIDWIKANMWL